MKKLKELYNQCPWWGKFLVGAAILFITFKWTPLLELLQVFAWMVLVPVLFLVGIGVISHGSYDAFKMAWERAQKMAEEPA